MAKKKKTGKTKAGKLIAKVKKGVKKVAGTIKKVASFPVLLPFKVAMSTILKSKGIIPEKDIAKLAQQFHSVIIEKKGTYEMYEVEHIAPVAISMIINGVIDFFKQLKKKKDSGATLTPQEETALNNAEATVGAVMEAGKEDAKNEIAKKSFTPLIIGGVIALIVIFLLVGKKKT